MDVYIALAAEGLKVLDCWFLAIEGLVRGGFLHCLVRYAVLEVDRCVDCFAL